MLSIAIISLVVLFFQVINSIIQDFDPDESRISPAIIAIAAISWWNICLTLAIIIIGIGSTMFLLSLSEKS